MLFNQIASIIEGKKSINRSDITTASTFDDLAMDSMDVVDLLVSIEEIYSVEIEPPIEMTTIGALVEYIDSIVSTKT